MTRKHENNFKNGFLALINIQIFVLHVEHRTKDKPLSILDHEAAPSTHSRKNHLLLAIFSNFTNSGGIKYSLMIA